MKKAVALVLALAMVLSMVSFSFAEEQGFYMDIPQQYRSWDEKGNNINFDRLGKGENGMVAALRYEPCEIGNSIMAAGGNAVDAAVAVALALTVTMPEMCGLAGGGVMTYYDATSGNTVFISFRETAPKFQTAEMWVQDENGNVIGNHNMYGGLSSGVPGEVSGLYYALEKYGTMEWKDVIQPAIELARQGYLVTPELKEYITVAYETMYANKELTEIYLDENGLVPAVNSIIRNEPMARALEMVRDQGPAGFYEGPMAEAMIKATQAAGGVMTLDDLKEYSCWEDEPATGTYRGYTISSAASPSSGGTFIIETLNILENLPKYEFNSVDYWHQLAEVQNMVWADRAQYMADVRYVDVPIAGILSKDYAKTLAEKVDMAKVQNFSYGNPWEFNYESANTTSFSVADKAGNMVTITHTINNVWGSRVYVDGYGFFMNDQLGDFVVGSGYSNSLEPGKAPLSSMSPTVVIDPEGKPFMTLGAPGGVLIYPGVCQVIMMAIDYGMNIYDAINSSRIAAMGAAVYCSKEMDPQVRDEFAALGYVTKDYSCIGMPTGIMFMPDGTLEGSAEIHGSAEYSDGVAVGY